MNPGIRAYFDHNATTPLIPEALEAMLPFLREGAANPSSTHREGQRARLAIEEAREQVAALAGAKASEIVFTSGGTEADNAAVSGAALAARLEGRPFPGLRIISTTLEHPAVHRALRGLETTGIAVTRIVPGPDGVVRVRDVAEALDETVLLVSVMHVNNEIGTIQPVEAIADACAARGVVFHTDAVQASGRIPLPDAPLVSLSAHKIGGPHGVGALVVRAQTKLEPLLRGGPQERRRRAGTENVAGIVGFGEAARVACRRLPEYAARVGILRGRLETGLVRHFPEVIIHGADAPRAANTSCFSLRDVDGVSLQVALDSLGFAVSTGTACASGTTAPSYVLGAIGASESTARAALRVSLSWTNTAEEIDRFVGALVGVVAASRAAAAVPA